MVKTRWYQFLLRSHLPGPHTSMQIVWMAWITSSATLSLRTAQTSTKEVNYMDMREKWTVYLPGSASEYIDPALYLTQPPTDALTPALVQHQAGSQTSADGTVYRCPSSFLLVAALVSPLQLLPYAHGSSFRSVP